MSSKRWLQEHFKDPYVKQAKEHGYASRAAYKLLELQAKDKFIKPGMTVVDLGAAPGGWSQVARELMGEKGRVIALDRLSMDPLSGVEFIQGDFTEQACLDQLLDLLGGSCDIVLSDMAPNMSGQKSVDQPSSMYLVELAFDCAQQVLKKGGCFLVKAFHGEGLDVFVKEMSPVFTRVVQRKPKSSRARSSEIYLLGIGFKG